MAMAEKNCTSSSQELILSDESCAYLMNQLGSPFNEFINKISELPNDVNGAAYQEYPDLGETLNAAPVKEECPVMEDITNMLVSVNQVAPELPIASSSLPATENWPGDFNFTVTFRIQENLKGAQCVYSKLKNKLYINKDVPCPINFSTSTMMTGDVCIRTMALFSSADQASEVVHRCVNHSMLDMQKNLPEAEHLVRCDSRSAVYINDSTTGRHSVIVPFENPPAGQKFSTFVYRFACFGSCSGGPNRRPLMLVFTLERNGAVIGRQRVDLKICACPARDMKADEAVQNPQKRKSVEQTPRTYADTVPNYHSAVKKIRLVQEKGPYYISTDDKTCYEYLKLMKKCFFIYFQGNKPTRQAEFLNFIRSAFSSSEDEEERGSK